MPVFRASFIRVVPRSSAALLLTSAATCLVACADNSSKQTPPAPTPAHAEPAKPAPQTHATTPASGAQQTPPPAPVTDDSSEERSSRAAHTVQFGIKPGNYDDTAKGVLVEFVVEGTSAQDAGIKEGDRLMTWNGAEVTDIYAWMGFLGASKPGDVVNVGVLRDGKVIPMNVTLKARKD